MYGAWGLKYVTEEFGGSIALFSTSKIDHLKVLWNLKFGESGYIQSIRNRRVSHIISILAAVVF